MSQTEEAKTVLPLDEVRALAERVLEHCGYATAHADAISDMLYRCQLDDCQSHGLFRLFMCATTMKDGKIDGAATPVIDSSDTAIIRADARDAMSLLAVRDAMPELISKARRFGMAALAVNNCFHFSALWPEVEELSAAGLRATHGLRPQGEQKERWEPIRLRSVGHVAVKIPLPLILPLAVLHEAKSSFINALANRFLKAWRLIAMVSQLAILRLLWTGRCSPSEAIKDRRCQL